MPRPSVARPSLTRPSLTRTGCDVGSGSVVVLAVGAVIVLAMVGVSVAAQVVTARHRAEAAADLAALAAASAAPLRGTATACSEALAITRAYGVRLEECSPGADGSVRVLVSETLPPSLAPLGPVVGRARARPAPP